MPGISVWDEWEETKARIEALYAEIKKLQKRERELGAQLYQVLGKDHGGVVLTRRQNEIMAALYGPPIQSNKEIALKLNMSERTVKFDISALLLKYGCRSRQELVMRFLRPREEERT